MRITIHQPDFIPWLGFFERWARSDLFLILDDVQYSKGGWQNRDKIKTPAGSAWLTVPVVTKGRLFQKTNEVEIDNRQNWRAKHLQAIETAYGKAPRFAHCFEKLRAIYGQGHSLLADLCIDLLMFLANELGITTPVARTSAYPVEGTATARLVNLMTHCGGTVYLTGLGSRDYLDESLFRDKGIAVEWQAFEHLVYPQLHGNFCPMLSALDFIMMVPSPNLAWAELLPASAPASALATG